MRELLAGQMDYVSFIYGLAFVLLASTCSTLYHKNKSQTFWLWLGAFGLIHGINEWLEMAALGLGDTASFQWLRLAALGVSFACLFEFGRALCGHLKYAKISAWIYIPIVLVIWLDASNGVEHLEATIGHALGISAGMLAAIALWRLSREDKRLGLSLFVAAGAMAVYALTDALGVPVLCPLAACGLGVMLWYYSETLQMREHTPAAARQLKRLMAGALLVLSVLLAGGWFWTEQRGLVEADAQRAQRLNDAQQALLTVEPGLVRDLSGSAADVDNPGYQILKTRLRHLRGVMPAVRFIYLMRRVGDKIIFLVDSEEPGSKDESPPGQVYDAATPKLKNIFITKKAVVDDPATDEWGRWVSAFVPFNDARTGELIAILGVDQDARSFEHDVQSERLQGIVLVGIICFGVLFMFVYWRRFIAAMQQGHDREALDWVVEWGMGLIVAGVGLALTASIFSELRHNAQDDFRAVFLQRAITRVQLVSQELDRQIDRLDGLRRFMDSRESVDRGEFSEYTLPLLKDVPIRAFEWIPRVAKAERIFYESSARQDGLDGFQIHEKNAAGKKIAALDRDEYFPVYYLEPLKGNEAMPGYDLASEPIRRAAMEKARDTGHPVATQPLELVQEGGKSPRVVLFMPVYAKDQPRRTLEQRRQSLKGFVLAMYSTQDFLKGVYSRMPPEGLACLVKDLAAPAGRQVLYRHAVRDGIVDWSQPLLSYVMPLEIPDRQWRVTIVPSSAFIARNLSRAYVWTLPVGGLLTALLAFFLNFLMMARYQAEKLVGLRTDELKKEKEAFQASEARLAATMRSIGDGVIACGVSGHVLTINAVTERLTGWSNAEARGRPVAEILHIVHEDTRQAVEIPVDRVLREDRVIDLSDHSVLISRDGTERQIADSCAPIHDLSGAVIGAVLVFRDVTEEYAQREQLRKSEESYRNQFAMNSAVMLLIDPKDGAIVDANAAAINFYGYPREQLLSMKIFEINTLPVENVQQALASVSQEHGRRFQFQHRLADGTLRSVESTSSFVQFGGRHLLHAIIFDITERKKAEEALAEQRKLLANVIEGTNVGTWRWDLQSADVMFNARWVNMLGYTLQDLAPVSMQTWLDLMHLDDLKKFRELLHKHLMGDLEHLDFECRMKHKDGTWTWVQERGKIVEWTPEGKPLVMAGTQADISARKQGEESLRQATDRLTMATRAGGVGIWDYDVVNNLLVWDEQMCRHYGVTPQQFGGKYETWLAAIHPEDRPRADEDIQMALRGEKELDSEFRVVWPDGSVHHIRGFAFVHRDAALKSVRVVGTNWDVTAQKSSEEEMNKIKVQLVQSDKLASLGEMATGMAHEINQPLNAIGLTCAMFRKLMQKKILTDEKLDAGLKDIDTSIRRMTQTIKHVRAYARQEVGGFELIDVGPTIEAALLLLGEQMRIHGIEVGLAIEPGLPQVRGEMHQLEQVWINFISNARDAMDDKQALIEKGALNVTGYQKKLQITVSYDKAFHMLQVAFADNGKGLTEAQAKKAFEPFFTTKEVGKGTGLGLSISRGIIEAHKGTISIDGIPGEGATLKVHLPADPA